MDLKALKDTPPWDWPAGTAERLVNVLRDEQAIESDRLLATDMAGDFTVVNDELVEALLAILRKSQESKQVRARAAISLGPILEYADTEDRKSTRLNSSHGYISYAVFCLKKKKKSVTIPERLIATQANAIFLSSARGQSDEVKLHCLSHPD